MNFGNEAEVSNASAQIWQSRAGMKSTVEWMVPARRALLVLWPAPVSPVNPALAATVANLTLVAGKEGLTGNIGSAAISDCTACADTGSAAAIFGAIRLGQLWPLVLLTPALLPKALFSTKAFHPHF